jgi:PAS domain S-box-containing protein
MKKSGLHPALRISLIYVVVAGAWILFSDRLLETLVQDPEQLTLLQSLKGLAFVMVMAGLIYLERSAADRASRRAEAALRQADRKYRDLVESAPIGIFRATREGRYITCNAIYAQMLGYPTPDALLASDVTAPQGPTQAMQALWAAGQGTLTYEWSYRRNDGRMIDTHLVIRVVTDGGGQEPHLEGFVEDITERKRTERKANQMADIVRSSQDAIFSVDMNSVITSWNPAAEAIYGYTAAEIEGHSALMLYPPDQLAERRRLYEHIHAGHSVSQFEIDHLKKNGMRFTVALTAAPIRDDFGAFTGVSVITRDITEQKALIARIEEQQQRLREYAHQLIHSQEDERKRLSRELHDDTLQDLVALAQRAELAHTALERDPAVALTRLEELQALAKEMVMKLRRISNDLRPLILEDLGVAAAVQWVCDELARTLPGCQVDCQISGEERRLEGDVEVTAFRIVQQAANNVRTHAPTATHVQITLAFEDDALTARVQDDGPGFEVVDTPELLRQGHLGLAGMQERARLLGGELTIESQPHVGTTITLRLPYQHT